ncbi:tyrosine-type recombinase/integrase [Robertkochia aurantiaca]|uniref:tyrosine-type recombinase/integrase n=1 Tax=Robertkochia aurantiaca TaxID=2873700 RepID=UPI001CC9291F|nr:tyrosine-type recombinase/integrase [Robertkochia sp. 3YJGBD-33]
MLIDKFADYLNKEKNYSSHTVTAYRRDLLSFSDFLEDQVLGTDPGAISYAEIRGWIVHLVNTGLGNRSVNRKLSSLNAYYRYLMKIGEVGVNPLSKHRALKTDKKVEVPFSEKEMNKAFELLPDAVDFEGSRDRLIVEMFYATGMRRAELTDLRIHDIDRANGLLKVRGKRNKERLLPLLPFLEETLVTYLKFRDDVEVSASKDYLFLRSNGLPVYDNLVYRIINEYFARVSVKVKRSPHILRHTFATHMLNNGADLNSVKELLGHSSLASTQVYTHNSLAELKKQYGSHPRNK